MLKVHQGDALGEGASVAGGFSGLVVDLFTRGVVIPQLQEEATWVRLLSRLRPGGRVMINAGGGCVESESGDAIVGCRASALPHLFRRLCHCSCAFTRSYSDTVCGPPQQV